MYKDGNLSTSHTLGAYIDIIIFFLFVYLALAEGAWYVSAYMVFTWLVSIAVMRDKNRQIKRLEQAVAKLTDM